MSNHEHERDEAEGIGNSFEDQLWADDAGGEALLHDSAEAGFDNREARDTLRESLDDPTDAIPKDQAEEPPPRKKSSLPFYGAVAAFAVVAVGLVGYQSGLIGGSRKQSVDATRVASAVASETLKKPDSLMSAAGAGNAASADPLGGGNAKPGAQFDAEAGLLADKSSGPAPAAAAAAAPIVASQGAPKYSAAAGTSSSSVVTPPRDAAPVAAAPVAAAPVASAPSATAVEKSEPVVSQIDVVKAPPPAAAPLSTAPARAARSESDKPVAVAARTVPAKAARRPHVVATAGPAKPTKTASIASKPVRVAVAQARKPSKDKGAGKIDKDATSESKEVLAGWKLRGTWPSHGPSQLAWIADDNGRLMTVSVGARISGARVVSIGNRGEVVQTTAGQIVP